MKSLGSLPDITLKKYFLSFQNVVNPSKLTIVTVYLLTLKNFESVYVLYIHTSFYNYVVIFFPEYPT